MKKILLLIVCLVSISAHSQLNMDSLNKQAEKLTAAKIYSDVKDGFGRLVTNLEGPAKHVYEIYVYQHKAEGLMFIFLPIIFLMVSIFLLYRYWTDVDWSDSYKACYATGLGVGLFIAFIACIIALFAGDYFTKIINPEYYAIQDVIKAFK